MRRAGAGVGHQPEGDAQALQLPGRQPRTLEKRPRLVYPHHLHPASGPRRLDDPQRRAVAGGGQRARVAVGQHPGTGAEEHGAVLADPAVDPHVLGLQLARPVEKRLADLVRPPAAVALEHLPAPVQGPGQVHGRGAGAPEETGDLLEAAGAEHETVGGGHADGGRATHGQAADGVGHLLGLAAVEPDLLGRQERLVQQLQEVSLPPDGGERLGRGGHDLGDLGHGKGILHGVLESGVGRPLLDRSHPPFLESRVQ